MEQELLKVRHGLVSGDVAKMLREKGCNFFRSVVTQARAAKWLRDKHQIGVFIQFDFDEYDKEPLGYTFDILDLKTNELKDFCIEYNTYEEAFNAGIKKALRYI